MCEEVVKFWRHCTECRKKILKGKTMHIYNWGETFLCQDCEDDYNKIFRKGH